MGAKRVAVLGATGVVGQTMLQILEERAFPVSELICLASPRSAGKKLSFNGDELEVRATSPEAFEGVDIVLSAVEDDMARTLLPEAVKRGCVCVDNSHAFRLDPEVPLIIPEINAQAIGAHKGIIANPNCATIIGLVAVWPLHQKAGLKRLVVSTYQAASGAGKAGLDELERELACVVSGESVQDSAPFAHQLANNLIPQIGSHKEAGYTSEEMKMLYEGRKIMELDELAVSCTCVRVPVMRAHSEAITAEFENEISPDEARELLAGAAGVKLVDNLGEQAYPMPLDAANQDLILVGRVRQDISAPDPARALSLWCSGDQIRKGAATNAVQIAEYLL